ncbi:MAG: arginine--tRNA ligase [Planctomycetota bacterium]|nr:arginine--tRNA ligase [Planctomycetota bacterium]
MFGQETSTDRFATAIARALARAGVPLAEREIMQQLAFPQETSFGDYAFPCFSLAKARRKSPDQAAAEVVAALKALPPEPGIASVESRGAYVNFFVDKLAMIRDALLACAKTGPKYGHSTIGNDRTVVIDYSSPNIAKPLSIGHLRSTVIGGALYRIFGALSYRCVGINHLGDWGTQIGTVIAAVKKWMPGASMADSSVRQLAELYARYHAEMAADPSLETEARDWFRKLENADPETVSLWKAFLELTIASLKRAYERVGVRFDSYAGESFFNDKIEPALKELAQRMSGKLVAPPPPGKDGKAPPAKGDAPAAVPVTGPLPRMRESEGALIVDLSDFGMPPCLLRKSDGATLYATRDIAAALYRQQTYGFARAVYVVAADQRLHFRQFFKVLELAGYTWASNCVHVDFGLIRFKGEKMATRAGTVVLLEDVLDRSIELTVEKMRDRRLDPEKQEAIARAVGIGAIIFHDLKHKRVKDVDFDWEQILRFDGETGPYVQYTYVRIASIFKKYAEMRNAQGAGTGAAMEADLADDAKLDRLTDLEEFQMAKLIHRFPAIVEQAAEKYEPSIIAGHLLDCAAAFHRYYRDVDRHKVVSDDLELTKARLLLCSCLKTVIANGLELLGIRTVEEM